MEKPGAFIASQFLGNFIFSLCCSVVGKVWHDNSYERIKCVSFRWKDSTVECNGVTQVKQNRKLPKPVRRWRCIPCSTKTNLYTISNLYLESMRCNKIKLFIVLHERFPFFFLRPRTFELSTFISWWIHNRKGFRVCVSVCLVEWRCKPSNRMENYAQHAQNAHAGGKNTYKSYSVILWNEKCWALLN